MLKSQRDTRTARGRFVVPSWKKLNCSMLVIKQKIELREKVLPKDSAYLMIRAKDSVQPVFEHLQFRPGDIPKGNPRKEHSKKISLPAGSVQRQTINGGEPQFLSKSKINDGSFRPSIQNKIKRPTSINEE